MSNKTFLYQKRLVDRQRSGIVFVTTQFIPLMFSELNISPKNVFGTLADAIEKLLLALFTYCRLALSSILFIRMSTGRNLLGRSLMMK